MTFVIKALIWIMEFMIWNHSMAKTNPCHAHKGEEIIKELKSTMMEQIRND